MMVPTTPQPFWWKYPMKPVRASSAVLKTVDTSKYVMEKKYDGWRAIVIVNRGATLWTREKRKIDLPDNLREQFAVMGIPDGTILDGEIWNPTKRGAWRHNHSVVCNLTLWDAIRLDHKDLSNEPLEARRAKLESLFVGKSVPDIQMTELLVPSLELVTEIEQEAQSFRESTQARSGFIHGVVLKRKGSPRRDHVTRSVEHVDWIKIVFSGMQSGV